MVTFGTTEFPLLSQSHIFNWIFSEILFAEASNTFEKQEEEWDVFHNVLFFCSLLIQICPEMHANERQVLYNKRHKGYSHIKVHQNTHDFVKHEVV